MQDACPKSSHRHVPGPFLRCTLDCHKVRSSQGSLWLAVSERSLGVYKVYYWLTTLLFVAMFIMAAWFVCLVAVNTTGELLILPQMQ